MRDYAVVLLPSSAQVETWLKARADESPAGSFAQTVTTFNAWIADLWELHGDGRAIVSSVEREVLARKALMDIGGALAMPGMASLAIKCVREASGVEAFEAAAKAAGDGDAYEGLSDEELGFLRGVNRYNALLADQGLVEFGTAAALLASHSGEVFPQPVRVLIAEAEPMAWIQEQLFLSCPEITYEGAPAEEDGVVPRAPEGIEVRYLFPKGPTAEPGLVADEIERYADRGDIVVACKDPLAMYDRVKRRLSRLGLRARLQSRKPFNQTDFGRMYASMRRFMDPRLWEWSDLSDVLFSPLSGFTYDQAVEFDKRIRTDRLADKNEVIVELNRRSVLFEMLGELLESPDADVCLAAFEQEIFRATYRSPAWRAEQLAAIARLRSVMAAARKADVSMDACFESLNHANLPLSVEIEGEGPSVLFTTQTIASRMGRGCCASLIVADLTTEDYPLADKDDAVLTLFAKLDIASNDTPLARARRQFKMLLKLPDERICFVRPLANADAADTYPCAMLEEFIDSYRPDLSTDDDIDNDYRLPKEFQDESLVRGEELLYENALALEEGRKQEVLPEDGPRPLWQHEPGQVKSLLTYAPVGPDGEPRPKLSASQIESYLECPYKWFVRKQYLETLDEGFGPLEKGGFVHEALMEFYKTFGEKVTKDNLPAARKLMEEILVRQKEEQRGKDPGERLVPVGELESREREELCGRLVSFLEYEADFLPSFHPDPQYLEYSIHGDDDDREYVDYGGCALWGRVDRIDVDDRGRAVIVDYKGSLNDGHSIRGKTPDHPGKVQALIYAQAVKRLLNLDVVGAVYVSYGKTPMPSGAYAIDEIARESLPGISDGCACGVVDEETPDALRNESFPEVLDAIEDVVRRVVASMEDEDIEPNPSSGDACKYCPVEVCPKRIA